MDYKVFINREVAPIQPGIGIRPIGQKNHKNNQKAFEEALKEQQEEKEIHGVKVEEEEWAGDLQEENGEGEGRGKNLNVLA